MKRIFLLFFVISIACSSSEPVVQNGDDQPRTDPVTEGVEDFDVTRGEDDKTAEYTYLSSLSDTYFNRKNEIPTEYAELKKEIVEEEKDLYEGYRIQIFSGQNVALADTAAKRFRVWSAENIDGYQAQTYTFFKAPYYRVHVGDFHDREDAIEFSNLLKRRFRDSWVVYDRVNPWNVPADSVQIIIKR